MGFCVSKSQVQKEYPINVNSSRLDIATTESLQINRLDTLNLPYPDVMNPCAPIVVHWTDSTAGYSTRGVIFQIILDLYTARFLHFNFL